MKTKTPPPAPAALPEAEQARRGQMIAEALNLRKCFEHADRWRTDWGTKTSLGLFRTLKRMIDEGK